MDIQARADALQEFLQSNAAHGNDQGAVATEVVDKMRQAGLLNLLSPKCFAGQELGFESVLDAATSLAHGCMSSAWVATVGVVHNWMAAGFSAEAQQEYFADPDVFSSASFAPTGTAVMTPEGFVANGRWGFLSGVDHADWVFVCALVADGHDERPAGPWFLMVPVGDITIDHTSWDVAGLRGTGSKDIVLQDVVVPMHRAAFLPLLGAGKGPGAGLHDSATFRTPFQPALIAVLAAPMLGAAQHAVAAFRQYTAGRVVKMTGAKQADQSSSQIVLASVSAQVDAAALSLRHIMQALDTGQCTTPLDFARVNRDVAYLAKELVDAVNTIMANSGGSALQTANPIQQIWRDVNAAGNHAALNWATQAQQWGRMALEQGDP